MRVRVLSTVFYLLGAASASAADLGDLSGKWRTVRHGALVTFSDCGNGTPCGRLAWVDKGHTDGHTTDVRNPDPARRGRKLIGLVVLSGFSNQGGEWRDGRLYNPDDGKTFRAHMRLTSANELKVTGCLGPLCRSQTWRRVK